MMDNGILDNIIKLLYADDVTIIKIGLEGLSHVLHWGMFIAEKINASENVFLIELERRKVINKLEKLQSHPDDSVYAKVIGIIQNFFEVTDAVIE